ncbi:MAG TPA: right-handed parallel beta-helix repeat-containing protein [Pseudonocardia sp.]|uniref:right-handed parallel beta-helix repeat-containing protein n=1 Tax=Pseudonocardia sp. TaxID=60912 RepID=UPI002F402450
MTGRGPNVWRLLTLCWLVLLVGTGCASAPVPIPPPPAPPDSVPRVVPKPTGCDVSLTHRSGVQEGVDAALPGQKICIFGDYVQGADLRVTRSGTRDKPISLVSDGSTLDTIRIQADNIIVEGFDTSGGNGIKASGNNIAITDNDVRGAADDGIRCAPCDTARVEGNTVRDADGSGIVISGRDIVAQHNDVAGSRKRLATDADGMRFSGTNLTLRDNTVHDINQRGYPAGTEPHPDCFHTFDSDGPTSYGVVLQDNRCVNVDAQCLNASGTQRHNAGVPEGQVAIQFLDNYCQSGADQAIYLDGYPDVVVRGNTFSSNYTTALLAVHGATGVTMTDNTLVGAIAPYRVDPASTAGFQQSGNANK